jgi:hypothetical protein
MQSIKVKSHVDSNGILSLSLPEIRDTDVEVTIVYQLIPKIEKLSLASLYGICADDPIIIDDEGISEVLDDDLEGVFKRISEKCLAVETATIRTKSAFAD